MQDHKREGLGPIRLSLQQIIFEAETPAGKLFDIVLIISILLSVAAVMLDSVAPIRERYGAELHSAEWFFTILFTIEYLLRLICVGRPDQVRDQLLRPWSTCHSDRADLLKSAFCPEASSCL